MDTNPAPRAAPAGGSDHTGVPASLSVPLIAGARRLAVQRAIEGAAWSVVTAVAAFACALAAVHVLGASGPAAAAPMRWSLFLGGAVLLAGCAAALLHARRTKPTLMDVARLADRRFGLDERLATALEVAPSAHAIGGNAPSPVTLALVRDAERHAAGIHPERLAPARVPRAVKYLPLALAPCILLALVPPSEPAGPDAFRSASRAILDADPVNPAAGVLAAASFLDGAASDLDDVYLAAVANAMRALGERVASGTVDLAEAESELARLLEHAEHASTAAETALAGSSGSRADTPPDQSPASAAPGGSPDAAPSSGEGRPPPDAPPNPDDPGEAKAESTPPRLGLDAVVAEVIAQREEGAQAEQQTGDGGDADAAYGEAEPRPGGVESGVTTLDPAFANVQTEPTPNQPGAPAATPDSPAGAASQTPYEVEAFDLYEEYYADLLADIVDLSHVPLSMRTATGGTEAAVELPPEARRATIRDAAIASAAWRRSDEEPYDPGAIALRYRAIASRYFQSMTERSDPGPGP